MDTKRGNFNNGRSTRNSWYSVAHGGLVPVTDLSTGHLCNIINLLRREAVAATGMRGSHLILMESCITYPALYNEAIKRGCWSWETLGAKRGKTAQVYEAVLEKKVETLEGQVRYLFAELRRMTDRSDEPFELETEQVKGRPTKRTAVRRKR